jgi:hypothetical protein
MGPNRQTEENSPEIDWNEIDQSTRARKRLASYEDEVEAFHNSAFKKEQMERLAKARAEFAECVKRTDARKLLADIEKRWPLDSAAGVNLVEDIRVAKGQLSQSLNCRNFEIAAELAEDVTVNQLHDPFTPFEQELKTKVDAACQLSGTIEEKCARLRSLLKDYQRRLSTGGSRFSAEARVGESPHVLHPTNGITSLLNVPR